MSQEQIIKYLVNRKGKHVDIVELCSNLNINRSNITRACKKLRENNEIKFKKVKNKNFNKFIYSV